MSERVVAVAPMRTDGTAFTWVSAPKHRALLAGVEQLRRALPLPATEPLTDGQVFDEAVAWIARGQRIRAAALATGWPIAESFDGLVTAMEAMARWRNRDLLVAERDALAADNARLLAELADRVDGDGERVAERERLEAERERLMADSKALAAVGRILVSAGRGPVSDIVHIVQGVADVLDERERLAAEHKAAVSALDRIHDTMTGRGYGSEGWEELARAVGVALEVTSARAEVIERIRVTVGAPADASCWGVAGAVMAEVQRLRDELAGYKRAHNRHTAWLDVRDDVLRPAPATGGDCGGEA